ncbi:hypothetical protein SPF06_00805 [Sinomonas sp. JGH33]|uniref:Uncharacterized protein n=1 Tax=Sinomonas terricola TaxID=3110330 RepID=A0ABU5T0S0_9MICC|nr:hypothetical protein [Sinomonas sp. JGH33]MEA5453249.1 hypothetical protein [Sinomonas sp. JGH33]
MTLTQQEIVELANEAFDEAQRICTAAGGVAGLDEHAGRDFDRANFASTWLYDRAKRT